MSENNGTNAGEVFAEVLQELRVEHGGTRAEFARDISASKATVQNWEAGKTLPKWDLIRAICVALNVSGNRVLGLPSTWGAAGLEVNPDNPKREAFVEVTLEQLGEFETKAQELRDWILEHLPVKACEEALDLVDELVALIVGADDDE